MIKQKCLIVEDQIDTFYFLEKAVLEAFPHLEVVHASSVKSAEQLIGNKNILNLLSLCLIDLGLPDGSGIDIIKKIKLTGCKVPLVVATIYDDDSFLFQALSVGATGYILKQEDSVILVELLKRIERNEPALSPAIARKLLNHFQDTKSHDVVNTKLTPRENETLVLITRGLTVAEVAKQLQLSPQTVSGYVKIIYQKLHVSNRVELMHEASKRKLI